MRRGHYKASITEEDVETAVIELKSLRMGAHKSCCDTVKEVAPVLMDFVAKAAEEKAKLKPVLENLAAESPQTGSV